MPLALAIAAFVFAVFAFLVATGTLVYVLARRFSTHEVRYEAPPQQETRYEIEAPPTFDVRDEAGGPAPTLTRHPPVSLSAAELEKRERLAALEEQFEEAAAYDYQDF